MRFSKFWILLIIPVLCGGCLLPFLEQDPPPTYQTSPPEPIIVPEPADCDPYRAVRPDPESNRAPRETIIQEMMVTAPSGNILYGFLRRPDPEIYPCERYPAVVLVPGGINPGRMEIFSQEARSLAGAGMVVVTFNAEGRVSENAPFDKRSEGTEDYNGQRHQDGLCALVKKVMDLPYVISENVGLKSKSYGITMAAGCAGRNPQLPIKYIVDAEGPPNSYVTCHEPRAVMGDYEKFQAVYEIFGHLSAWRNPEPENVSFWKEREAERFIGDYRGRYLRLQAEWDHAQPPSSELDVDLYYLPEGPPEVGLPWWQGKHAMDMVNAAVAGGVPWVRMNLPEQGNPVNETFGLDHFPTFLPGFLADQPWAVRAVLEMARME